jgi:hypothetical protein
MRCHVGIYRQRHQPATQDDPFEPDPDEDQDPPESVASDRAAPLQAIPAPDGPEGELRRLTETLEAASRRLRPPGHDPP